MNISDIGDDPTRAGRYLAGQLSDAECAEYEARFVRNPDTVAELEATARLKVGLERLRESGELSELLAGGARTSVPRTAFWALAAGVAAIAIGISLWHPHGGSNVAPVLASAASVLKDSTGHQLAVVAIKPMFRTRAETYDAVIELPQTRGAIRLRVLPSAQSASGRYEATLARMESDDSSQAIVTLEDLRVSPADGFVDLYADSALLAPGRYRLILAHPGSDTSGSAQNDAFLILVNGPHTRN